GRLSRHAQFQGVRGRHQHPRPAAIPPVRWFGDRTEDTRRGDGDVLNGRSKPPCGWPGHRRRGRAAGRLAFLQFSTFTTLPDSSAYPTTDERAADEGEILPMIGLAILPSLMMGTRIRHDSGYQVPS